MTVWITIYHPSEYIDLFEIQLLTLAMAYNRIDSFLIALAKVASTLSAVPCIHIWNENEIVAAAVMIMIARRPFSDSKNHFYNLSF